MKRLLLILCGAILLSCFGPTLSVRAQGPQGAAVEQTQEKHHWWNFHRNKVHKQKTKKDKHAKEGQQQSAGGHLYNIPKTVGWWRKGPGPAGAGAN